MAINIPDPTAQEGYLEISAERKQALEKALEQFKTENDPSSGWEDAGTREQVELSKKTNPENAYDVPIVKGVTVVEEATPEQVLATIQIPGFRKKWDPRFDEAHSLERYDANTFLFYSVMKSPSYFVWARDILGVQQNMLGDDEITIVQTSSVADEYVSEDDSYSKSRTRATLEFGVWKLTKEGNNTKVEYIVKVHLNGSLPVSVVSMVATETPMCVGRVRDVFYQYGHTPYLVEKASSTILQHAVFEDGDGTEATSGAKTWAAHYRGAGEDTYTLKYDEKRMYTSGVNVSVDGEGASDVKTEVDAAAGTVKVSVGAGAQGKPFIITIKPQ